MAKLFTSHDPFHIHKILGLLVLLNFAYRLISFAWKGFAFCQVGNKSCSQNEIYFDVFCTIIHACLSWSSLLLPVPKKRNYSAPMIWLELRWHSIIFASRHIIATIISILGLWPQHWAPNYIAHLALVMGTCVAADWATKVHGCKINRTTNAMPYPDYITPALQQKIKLNYSMAQMAAALSFQTENPTHCFLALYGIQGSAFLLTLRRKNLISTRSVHYVYQLQLCAMYLPLIYGLCNRASCGPEYWAPFFLGGGLYLLAGYLRIDLRKSKLFVWSVTLAIWQLFTCNQACHNVLMWFHTHPVGIAYVVFSHVNEYQRVLRHYLPIWRGQASKEDVTKKPHETQSLKRDLLESDMLAHPDRRQRFLMVFTALVGSHFGGLEVAEAVAEKVMPGLSTKGAVWEGFSLNTSLIQTEL